MLACCPVTVAEIFAGVRSKEERLTATFLETLQWLPLDYATSELAGRLKLQHALITSSRKDFPMAEISLFPLPE